MQTLKVIALAHKHIGGDMETSARLCLSDAVQLFDKGQFDDAKKRALDSLKYSLGVFHPVYTKASAV